MTADLVQHLFIWYLVFLFSTTFHEFAHAYLAYRAGDLTAYEAGHVTLDPLPHIRRSPIGMVLMPVLSFLQLGWMVGFASVPYSSEWGRNHPRRQAFMSLAGPLANLFLALLALATIRGLVAAHVLQYAAEPGVAAFVEPIGSGGRSPLGALALALGVMLKLNVVLCLFNLIPVPPLDGAGVLGGFFPGSVGALYDRLHATPAFQFLGLLIAWRIFPYFAAPAFRVVGSLLYP